MATSGLQVLEATRGHLQWFTSEYLNLVGLWLKWQSMISSFYFVPCSMFSFFFFVSVHDIAINDVITSLRMTSQPPGESVVVMHWFKWIIAQFAYILLLYILFINRFSLSHFPFFFQSWMGPFPSCSSLCLCMECWQVRIICHNYFYSAIWRLLLLWKGI